jgi:hypothetical protein
MTEIGLLMKGVLTNKQIDLPPLTAQQPFSAANGMQQSKKSQETKLVSTHQVTPPEFIKIDKNNAAQLPYLRRMGEKIIADIRRKRLFANSLELTENLNQPVAVKQNVETLALYQRVNSQPMPTLNFGHSGLAVRILQQLLVASGYGLEIDGIFGPLTETAVRAFQTQRRIVVDGIVGRKTWWELTI